MWYYSTGTVKHWPILTFTQVSLLGTFWGRILGSPWHLSVVALAAPVYKTIDHRIVAGCTPMVISRTTLIDLYLGYLNPQLSKQQPPNHYLSLAGSLFFMLMLVISLFGLWKYLEIPLLNRRKPMMEEPNKGLDKTKQNPHWLAVHYPHVSQLYLIHIPLFFEIPPKLWDIFPYFLIITQQSFKIHCWVHTPQWPSFTCPLLSHIMLVKSISKFIEIISIEIP